ncbi:MAG: NAD-dependent epimerase/dehydratase family protein [Deltaproteobacteria bacterium]|nr:MAG: NAD-dependent epimerase/dehydratase family protein [Deltaproteobacteria bacterium]
MIGVLVTGATTAIGERLVRALVADTRVRHVIAVGRSPETHALPFAHGDRLTYVHVDLAKSRRVHELLFGLARDLEIEVVVHLDQHQNAFNKGKRVHQETVEATRSILELSHRHPTIRRVVLKSYAEVYKVSLELPVLVTEDHPLNLDPRAPQYIRDRVEADLTACSRMGFLDAEVVVLRCAEALGPGTGSQLFSFLDAPLALRPAGFDPMVNVATIADIAVALELATHGSGEGVFNVPGFDTLPLSESIRKWGTPCVPAPGPLIRNAYRLRHAVVGAGFSYGINRRRMHYGLVLAGNRAADELGYVPENPVDWPVGGPVRT